MDKVSDLGKRRALKDWMQRMAQAGWQGHTPASPFEGILGGPTLYLCSVERRVHIVVHLFKDGVEQSADFARQYGVSFADACNYLGTALEDAARMWPNYSREVQSALMLFAALYLPGTEAYRGRRLGAADPFLILHYRDVSTDRFLLRPVRLNTPEVISPTELEAFIEMTLAVDRARHPERFRRGEVLPFRLRTRETPGVATADAGHDATASEALNETLADPQLPAPLRERLKRVKDTTHANLRAILERIGEAGWDQFEARIHALVDRRDPPWVRLRALYAIADELLAKVEGHAACRRGCAHCCHIRVDLTKTEAQMLGSAIRQKPKVPSPGNFETFEAGYDKPCTFLVDRQCSIYAHRPLACRVHVNVDEDALLCELNEWTRELAVMPGLALKETFDWAYVRICGTTRTYDIREFFPSGGGAAKRCQRESGPAALRRDDSTTDDEHPRTLA